MSNLQVFTYNGNPVTFAPNNGGTMLNATEMAKHFEKQPSDWLRQGSAKEFIDSLSAVRGIPVTGLVVVKQGGNIQGTWMHEDVALEFARWLSPSFAIWCNDRIKELLKFGMTASPEAVEAMLSNPDLVIGLATALKEERERVRILSNDVVQLGAKTLEQERQLKAAAPKVEYFNEVLQSESIITTNVIAKELGMSAVSLNKMLHRIGVIYKCGDTWVLYHRYQDKGFTRTRTVSYVHSNGLQKTAIHTYWTEAGRLFIHRAVKQSQNVKVNQA